MDSIPIEEKEKINPQTMNQENIMINLDHLPDNRQQSDGQSGSQFQTQSDQQIQSQLQSGINKKKKQIYFVKIPFQIQLILSLIALALLISCYFVDAIVVDTYDYSHNIIQRCVIKFYGKKKCEICQSNQRVTTDIYMVTLEDQYRDYYSNYFTFNPILQTCTIVSLIISIYLKSKALYGLIKYDWSLVFSFISIIFNLIVPLYLLKQVDPGSTEIQKNSLILNFTALLLQIITIKQDFILRQEQQKINQVKINFYVNPQLILVIIAVILLFICYFFEQFIYVQGSTNQKCYISIFGVINCRNQTELTVNYSSRINLFECYNKPFCQIIILYPYLMGIGILFGLYTIYNTYQHNVVKASTLFLNLFCTLYIFICITLLLSLNNIHDLEIKIDLNIVDDSKIAPLPAIFQYFACCLFLISFYVNLKDRITQLHQRRPLIYGV